MIIDDGYEKHAFKMQLNPGMAAEYKRRHDAIYPDLVDLLHEAGVKDYSIHLDEETNTLFGVLWRRVDHTMADLRNRGHAALVGAYGRHYGDQRQERADLGRSRADVLAQIAA
jgi:L-rhamnose mutarotase